MEHAAGPEVTEALAELLEKPTRCPHGNPIPSVNGEFAKPGDRPLNTLQPGEHAVVRRVQLSGAPALAYLAENGITPGTKVKVKEIEPLDEILMLSTDAGNVVVGRQIASQIFVE